ncbi:MAG: FAD-binding oxidoreductase [Janthinobacterium lividum]
MTDPDALAAFVEALADIPVLLDPTLVKQRSRDFFWYSPVLKRQLNDMTADVVVCPRTRDEVAHTMAAAWQFGINITPRGGGTGNYGQAVPLRGGAVLDLTRLDRIVWVRDGMMRVEAGAKLIDLERVLRERGWELRMFPSTKRTATIGGFVAGGSGGVGSIAWGGLRDAGNVIAAQVITAEATPRVLELCGTETDLINHTYGTTGIVTELELPLAPAMQWRDVVVAFPDFMQAARFCLMLAACPGIDLKLVTTIDSTIVPSFKGLRELVAIGESLALLMVAPSGMVALAELVTAHEGQIVLDADTLKSETTSGLVPLYEFTWNHTTLQMLKQDRTVTYLQSLFPAADPLALVERMRTLFGDELPMHLEFLRVGGALTCAGLQIVRFTTEERLAEIIRIHEQNGVSIANPHVYTIEDGSGHKRLPGNQLGFKHEVDPLGILNPGKMRDYVPMNTIAASAE